MIDQIGIALTGVTAIFLTQSKHDWLRRYACLFGMAGQPFWIYSALHAQQWGVLTLTALYTAAWAKGIYAHWIQPSVPDWSHPFARRGYIISEPHLDGYRVIVGFDSLADADAAHEHIAAVKRGSETSAGGEPK
ncbi:hypothetical protein UFOVP154_58 [uncultured Caudovirales phage]|uniref:Uncharacterized protein n=1 Tax=uncultured Caudovirales phage TaxID=2100421 RepID=A0A6J7WCX9_9CAUD|nr:hypothetical protein UFOVP8_43 [uncultured Caudovirales phage]CAB5170931.1 hypothetical protein UFOVP154_58 [uncultured Caudovirales phage]